MECMDLYVIFAYYKELSQHFYATESLLQINITITTKLAFFSKKNESIIHQQSEIKAGAELPMGLGEPIAPPQKKKKLNTFKN